MSYKTKLKLYEIGTMMLAVSVTSIIVFAVCKATN